MKRLSNGEIWKDTDGNDIHAHGGCIIFHDGYYYWYGEDRRADHYVSCYRSKNLASWEFRNWILGSGSQVKEYRVKTRLSLLNPDGTKVNIERPKVLFNEKTGRFVMWAHFENGKDYKDAQVAIASCDTPDGNFTYHGSFNPYGFMSRDCTLFKDEDGTAYFISAARDNADLHVYRLTDDYMNVDKLVNRLWQGEYREAPAVFKHNGTYYMLSSYCTGWAPNQCKYARADRMDGKWSMLEDIGDETTYDSQAAFVLTPGDRIFYFGDRWGGNGDKYFESSYVVYELALKDDRLEMIFSEYADIGWRENNELRSN